VPFSKAVLLDTRSLLAYVDSNHKHHLDAKKWFTNYFSGNFNQYDRLVTSDFIISELTSILFKSQRSDDDKFQILLKIVRNLIHSPNIEILYVKGDAFYQSWTKLEKYYSEYNLKMNLVDGTTLSLLKMTNIRALFSYNPVFHILHELLRMDVNPEQDSSESRLRYEIIPDKFVYEHPILITQDYLLSRQASALFDLRNDGWVIRSLSTDNKNMISILSLQIPKESTAATLELPLSFNNFKKLEQLDLSDNKLIAIPESLIPLQKFGCQIVI